MSKKTMSITLALALSAVTAAAAAASEVPIPGFRPPSIPFITSDPYTQNWVHGTALTDKDVSYWDGLSREMVGLIRVDGTQSYRWLGTSGVLPEDVPAVTQKSVSVYPTRTVVVSEVPGVLRLTVTTFAPMFAKELELLARPTNYVIIAAEPLDGAAHTVQLYFDATGYNCVNLGTTEVTWDTWAQGPLAGAKIGSAKQKVLGLKGDHVGIDWGYAHVAVPAASGKAWAGASKKARASFLATGALPSESDDVSSNSNSAKSSAACGVIDLGQVSGRAEATFLYAYDDVKSIKFFGAEQAPYWTRQFAGIEALLCTAYEERAALLAKAAAYDSGMLTELAAVGGAKYATMCALAYRQALASTKVTWNEELGIAELFLKEISSNGDMQTADVIFPTSPAFLYANPRLLEMLLAPLLRYSNNETSIVYTEPFSPHEIGVYPIADHTTRQQEKMPMENTGNLFLMIRAILRANGGDASFFYPKYWRVLSSWANYLAATLPFPENQLCTDDFTGRLANNTNLAAKGIIALAAFADICDDVTGKSAVCAAYRSRAVDFAATWTRLATVEEPARHTAISFNKMNLWSLKYNLLWQRLLRMGDSPFRGYDALVKAEVDWYVAHLNDFGTPIDARHKYTKLDWLAWVSFMADNEVDYNKIFDTVYKFADETPTRLPLCDLYYTTTATPHIPLSFIARPVVGALFAKALL